MKKGRKYTALAILLFAVTPVWAQSKLEPPQLDQFLRWGPLRVRPGVEFKNFGYDDNITNNAAQPVGDFTATPLGRLDGLVLFGSSAFLEFRERLGYTFYLENPNQNFPVQIGKARITMPIKRMGLFGELVLNRDTTFPVDISSIRPDRKEDGLALGLIFEPGWRTTLELAQRATRWRYDDSNLNTNIEKRLNRTNTRTTLGVVHSLTDQTHATLDMYYGDVDFEFSLIPGQRRDYGEWGIIPGVRLGEGGALSGEFKVGWAVFTPKDPDEQGLSDVVVKGDLVYRPTRRIKLLFRAQRIPGFTTASTSTFYVDAGSGAGLVYYLNRLIGLEGNGYYGRVTFSGGNSRVDKTQRYNLALRLRMARNDIGSKVEYRLRYQYSTTESIVPTQNITRARLFLDVLAGF